MLCHRRPPGMPASAADRPLRSLSPLQTACAPSPARGEDHHHPSPADRRGQANKYGSFRPPPPSAKRLFREPNTCPTASIRHGRNRFPPPNKLHRTASPEPRWLDLRRPEPVHPEPGRSRRMSAQKTHLDFPLLKKLRLSVVAGCCGQTGVRADHRAITCSSIRKRMRLSAIGLNPQRNFVA